MWIQGFQINSLYNNEMGMELLKEDKWKIIWTESGAIGTSKYNPKLGCMYYTVILQNATLLKLVLSIKIPLYLLIISYSGYMDYHFNIN